MHLSLPEAPKLKVARDSLLLYAVTDRSWLGRWTLADQVEDALRGGATFVQLREKELSPDELVAQAIRVKAVTDKWKVPFVINDSVEAALACGADGVHLGQEDRAAADARAMLGEGKILGVSVQTVEQALWAQRDGADYLGVGAVFPTASKLDAADVPLQVLKDICAAVSIPVVAIGGIHEENILQLAGSGIAGVAVISALFSRPDIALAARTLRDLSGKVAR